LLHLLMFVFCCTVIENLLWWCHGGNRWWIYILPSHGRGSVGFSWRSLFAT